MAENIAIQVKNLSKIYKLYNKPIDRLKESLSPIRRHYHHDFYALNDVTFEVYRGETVGIIGKNGSGKSTLLKLITGILSPTSGTINVNGKISALLELGAGFNPELTGLENVYFNGTLMGYSKGEMDGKIDDILSFADIGEFITQPVKTYSSGMFVRLAFAVAINVKPEILIVDEALSVGDTLFRAKCLTVIDKFRQDGASVLYVTHDIASIKSLCSRAIYLVKGSVAATGKSGKIADMYIKDLREEKSTLDKYISDEMITDQLDVDYNEITELDKNTQIKVDNNLQKINNLLRYGTREAEFTAVEILNVNNEPVTLASYNDIVKIVMHIKCNKNCTLSVNYNIRDSDNVNIIGSNFRIENIELINASPMDNYIVEYTTSLPLEAGNYNISVSITEPVVLNKTARFIDVIEHAITFAVLERQNAKLWSKVYIDNNIVITKCR